VRVLTPVGRHRARPRDGERNRRTGGGNCAAEGPPAAGDAAAQAGSAAVTHKNAAQMTRSFASI